MTAAFLALIAVLLIAVAGSGLAVLALPRRETAPSELLAWTVILGTVFVSLGFFITGFFLPHPLGRYAVAVSALALGGFTWRRFPICKVPAFVSRREQLPALLLLSIVLVQIVIVFWLSLSTSLAWDGLFCWEIKAHVGALQGFTIAPVFYADPARTWSHPDYPNAIPMLEEWLYSWIGEPHQAWAKLLFPFYYLAAIALLFTSARRAGRSLAAAFATAALPFFVPCLVVGAGSASSGLADFPLATVYLAATLQLLDYANSGAGSSLRLLSICAAILPWLKREGIILAGCLFVLCAVVSWRRRQIGAVFLAVIPTMLVWAGLRIFVSVVHASPSHDFSELTFSTLLDNWERLGDVAQFLARESVNWSRWGLLWLAALCALCDLARRGRERPAHLLLGALALPIAAYSCVYIFSAWPNFRGHISTSLPRLLLGVALVAVFAIGAALPCRARREKIPARA